MDLNVGFPFRVKGFDILCRAFHAIAAGKCRVATRIDGIPTVIEDGIDGLLVEKKDVGQLAATLARLIADAPLRRRPGDAARVRMGQELSGDSYLEHYTEFVSGAHAQRRT